jgi:hypothetical protein
MKRFVGAMLQRAAGATGIPHELHALSAKLDARPPSYVDKGTQILLGLRYRELAAERRRLPFDQVEFRNHSQNGEDGILWYVLSLVGELTKTCVEICAADGVQCNCANLLINHGWTGLLVDGDQRNVESGRSYFGKHPDTFAYPPKFVQAWITAENVNALLAAHGVGGEIDLLSLDIDGMDYWVWKALSVVSPRVVIAEIQAIWKCDASVTVPYKADFRTEYIDGFGVYSGASLPAFVKLAKDKGYRLVGCQRYGFNAVFLRNDVGADVLPAVAPESCFGHPFCDWAHEVLLPKVKDKAWVAV